MNIDKLKFEAWIRCYCYNNAYILFVKRKWRRLGNVIIALSAPYILLWFDNRKLSLKGYRKELGELSYQDNMKSSIGNLNNIKDESMLVYVDKIKVQ